jgi:hypothetical protein
VGLEIKSAKSLFFFFFFGKYPDDVDDQDKMAKRQLVIYKTLHRKLNIRQQVPHKRPVVNSGAPEG